MMKFDVQRLISTAFPLALRRRTRKKSGVGLGWVGLGGGLSSDEKAVLTMTGQDVRVKRGYVVAVQNIGGRVKWRGDELRGLVKA